MLNRIVRSSAVLTFALTAATLAAPAANAAPLGHLFHYHAAVPDTRVTFTVYNSSMLRREVRIGSEVYFIEGHRRVAVTAPVGTTVFEYSKEVLGKDGALLMTVSSADDDRTLKIS